MAYWAKFDLHQITERRNGAIFKTRKLRSEWHRHPDFPETYTANEADQLYSNTTEVYFGPDKPKDD